MYKQVWAGGRKPWKNLLYLHSRRKNREKPKTEREKGRYLGQKTPITIATTHAGLVMSCHAYSRTTLLAARCE